MELVSICNSLNNLEGMTIFERNDKNLEGMTVSHLICTLISENEGLEKLRSASNLRKISVPAHLIFFSVCHLNFFLIYTIDLKKIQVAN